MRKLRRLTTPSLAMAIAFLFFLSILIISPLYPHSAASILFPPRLLSFPTWFGDHITCEADAINVKIPAKNPSQKHSALVQGEAAGLGFPDRVQCTKTSKSFSFPRRFCTAQRVIMVSLFVPAKALDETGCHEAVFVADRVLVGPDKGFAVLQVYLESISMFMPSSSRVILTDSQIEFPQRRLPSDLTIERIPGNYSRDNLMLQRLQSYISYLGLQIQRVQDFDKEVKHVIFTDSDIIVVGDLGCVFEQNESFDVGLTFRNNQQQPINSGVVLVRGTRKGLLNGKLFLEAVVRAYKENYLRASRMLGDQLAFAWVLRNTGLTEEFQNFKKAKNFTTSVMGMEILFLPSYFYNWTPPEGAGQFHGMALDVKVIHFKGSRKRLMLEAWIHYKRMKDSGIDLSEMQCLVLRSGRAKYDF